MRALRIPTLTALVLAAGVGLAGCSGSGDSASSADNSLDRAASQGADGADSAGSADEEAAAEGVDTRLPFDTDVLSRQVITTADITVRSADVSRDAERAAQLTTTVGGQISGDVRAGADERQTADLVLRVPPGDVADVLTRLGELGEELSREVRSDDVTTVVADVDSRVASLEASLDRLRALIADATDISDLVALERELTSRETDLESLQAQQRALADEVALATVSLHLVAAEAEVPGDEPAGFLGGLSLGWDAFLTIGATLLTALGAALPFLATVAGLVTLAVVLRRRRPTMPVAEEPS